MRQDNPLSAGRLEAFSDGVIAVIITIMVLELRPPDGANLTSLLHVAPMFLFYVLSFVAIGIFWNNHHHLLRMARQINSGIMWANLHFLFWLSLIPFATRWLGENHRSAIPTMLYGSIFLFASLAYYGLERSLVKSLGQGSPLQQALGSDQKGKLSLAMYLGDIVAAQWAWELADALYILVAIMWFIPDPRVASKLRE